MNFFDRAAKHYEKIFSIPFLKFLKQKEMNSVKDMLGDISSKTILDAGCGTGIYSVYFKKFTKKIICVDVSKKMIKKAKRKKLKSIIYDLSNFYLNERFDIVFLLGVLEFSDNTEKEIKNIKILLKKNGILIILFPIRSSLGHLYKFFHSIFGTKIKLFDVKEVINTVHKNGLEVLEMDLPTSFSCVIKAKNIKNLMDTHQEI